WRRLGRTCLSSNPIVAMSAPTSMESPEEQLNAGRGDDHEPAAVGRIGLALDRAHRRELAQLVVHRGLVDPQAAGHGSFGVRLLRGRLLADIRSKLPCDLQEIIGVADLDRGTRAPQPSAKFHDLGPSVPALRMIAVVERDAVEMARRPDRREQALRPPAKGAEKHGHAPCSPSSNNKKFLPSNPATIR